MGRQIYISTWTGGCVWRGSACALIRLPPSSIVYISPPRRRRDLQHTPKTRGTPHSTPHRKPRPPEPPGRSPGRGGGRGHVTMTGRDRLPLPRALGDLPRRQHSRTQARRAIRGPPSEAPPPCMPPGVARGSPTGSHRQLANFPPTSREARPFPVHHPLPRSRQPTNSPLRANWRLGPPSDPPGGLAPAPDGPRRTARRPPPRDRGTAACLRRGAA